jgi:V8-like Glu-specific endopeptidase
VYVLGFPFALPLKYDSPTPISFIRGNVIFAQLDIAGGNSGSPVLNARTNVVEGTLGGYSSSGANNLDPTAAGCNIEHHATPNDNYYAYANSVALFAGAVPPTPR